MKSSLNTWILTKIIAYLTTREGYQIEFDPSDYTERGFKTIVRDSLGYRYEVRVKLLSRIVDYVPGYEE